MPSAFVQLLPRRRFEAFSDALRQEMAPWGEERVC